MSNKTNQITFESAIETLKVMFPEWDEDTLTTILMSNHYHVERTIEAILVMSGDTNVSSPAAAVSGNNNPVPAPSSSSSSSGQTQQPAVEDLLDLNPSGNNPPRSTSNESRDGVLIGSSGPTAESRYRGRMCSLPDDFLRPPGYSPRIIADEELALMLQNELFRKEAQRILGEDLRQQQRAQRAAAAGGANAPQRRDSRPGGDNTASSSTDLGIIKGLSSMGGAARRNLSQLAERFSQSSKANNRNNNGNNTTQGREFRPLVDNSGEDDFEIINFDKGNRNKHRLQSNGGGVGADGREDEEFGYKNPLFRQGSENDVNK